MQIENCKLKIAKFLGRTVSDPVIGANDRRAAKAASVTSATRRRFPGVYLRSPGARICNLHFSIFDFQFFSLTLLCSLTLLLALALAPSVSAQIVPDKIVASVTNGSQATPDVITYSEIVWQLALEPGEVSPARPSSDQLKHALDLLVQQMLVVQEARKLPLSQTAAAQNEFDQQVQEKLRELIQLFGSRARLEERMKQVGLTGEQLDQILRDRVTMDRYIDFRFKAFAIVSDKEIEDRYERDYRRPRGNQIVKTLDQARAQIEHDLTEEKISVEIDNFIDRLRDQPGTEIVILNPV